MFVSRFIYNKYLTNARNMYNTQFLKESDSSLEKGHRGKNLNPQ